MMVCELYLTDPRRPSSLTCYLLSIGLNSSLQRSGKLSGPD